MPTFDDPVTDGEEVRQALRALAHATRAFDSPAQTYGVVGDLLAGLRSLEQVLDQVAEAHTGREAMARHATAARAARATARVAVKHHPSDASLGRMALRHVVRLARLLR
jgi:hypothetical protein